jgi:uncharacterized protein (TIGR02118 family)
MIRVLAFMRRLPGVSRDAFRSHYEEIHVPTALPTLGGIVGYVRHHVREEILGATGFDCMTRFDYRDAAAIRAALARIEGPEGEAIHRDERLFMDAPANVFFPVEEAEGWGEPGAEPTRLLLCVRRSEGEQAADFRARLLERQLPALRAASRGAGWCRPHFALPGLAQGQGFDLVAQLGADAAASVAAWAGPLEAEGASLIAARVSVHETPMPG